MERSRLAPTVGVGRRLARGAARAGPPALSRGSGRLPSGLGWDVAPSSGPQGAARRCVLCRPAFPPRGQEAAPVDAGRRAVPAVDGGAVGSRARQV